jgi:type II secretory pathway component PulK
MMTAFSMTTNRYRKMSTRTPPPLKEERRAAGIFQAPLFQPARSSDGSILVGVLWCLALLSVVVIGTLHSSRLDLVVVKTHGDRIQAHYLALAGIEKAKALLYRQTQQLRDNRQNYSPELFNAPNHFREVPFGRGRFSVIRQARENERGPLVYGISDEESRLHLNRASSDELAELPGLNSQIAAAIADFRDSDNNLTPGGAEAETYTALQPPYLPRNAPLLTTRELLMVRGITGSLFFGELTRVLTG